MKMKSFAMIVMPGLLAASFACIAPAMADDMNTGSGQSMGSGMSQGTDNSSNDNSSNDNAGNSNNTDQGSPDTATGDDDY